MCKTINFNEYKLWKISQRENERKMFENITNEIRNRRQEGHIYISREMEEISRKFLSKLNEKEQYEGPIPIVKIAKKLGFNVYQQDMEKELSGFIAIDEEIKQSMGNDKIIVVNVNDEIGHQRFVIAHELAHYLFDYEPKDNVVEYYNTYYKDTHDSESEVRANRFAAELLMPRDRFVDEVLSKGPYSLDLIKDLQNSFQVQDKAIIKRLHEV